MPVSDGLSRNQLGGTGTNQYDPEYARMEAWLDEHPDFAQDYFLRYVRFSEIKIRLKNSSHIPAHKNQIQLFTYFVTRLKPTNQHVLYATLHRVSAKKIRKICISVVFRVSKIFIRRSRKPPPVVLDEFRMRIMRGNSACFRDNTFLWRLRERYLFY